jgi:hypothetical protein
MTTASTSNPRVRTHPNSLVDWESVVKGRFVLDNDRMTDIPIYVALITAGAGLLGAMIPQSWIVIREIRQQDRDRRDRYVTEARGACIDLLRASGGLSAHIKNMNTYRGDGNGLRTRLEEARSYLADIQLYAAGVGMAAPSTLTELAGQLATVAESLIKSVEEVTDLDNAEMLARPDTGPLDELISAFRDRAVASIKA